MREGGDSKLGTPDSELVSGMELIYKGAFKAAQGCGLVDETVTLEEFSKRDIYDITEELRARGVKSIPIESKE